MRTSPENIIPDLRVEHVTVVYNTGQIALRDASFHIRGGTICALLGVNGSGKSTLFKTIMGGIRPAAGAVSIAGMTTARARKANLVSYVPQAEEVDWSFPVSVMDVVLMGRYGHMNFLRLARSEDRRVAQESLERVRMWDLRGRQIGELSGGQKKRVFLARALAQQGRLMLLDEPFTGVDTTTQAEIIHLLRELRAEGHLILISTHDLAAVPDYCDEAVILKGRVLAAGPLAQSFTSKVLTEAFGTTGRWFDRPGLRAGGATDPPLEEALT